MVRPNTYTDSLYENTTFERNQDILQMTKLLCDIIRNDGFSLKYSSLTLEIQHSISGDKFRLWLRPTYIDSVQSDVVSIMASNGTGDYSGIDANALKAAEKDIKFVADASVTANKNSVGIISVNGGLGLKIVAADNKNCYAAQMQPGIATIYEKTTTSACNTTALVATSSPTATVDNTDRQLTWK